MLNFGVLLTIVLGGASVFFYSAGQMRASVGWANDACAAMLVLCRHPDWPALAAALLICAIVIIKVAVGSRG